MKNADPVLIFLNADPVWNFFIWNRYEHFLTRENGVELILIFKYRSGTNFKYESGTNSSNTHPIQILTTHPVQFRTKRLCLIYYEKVLIYF